MDILRRATDPSDVRPSYDHFFRFLGNYLQGNSVEAANQAYQITGLSNPRAHS
jgi:hypothetical protein